MITMARECHKNSSIANEFCHASPIATRLAAPIVHPDCGFPLLPTQPSPACVLRGRERSGPTLCSERCRWIKPNPRPAMTPEVAYIARKAKRATPVDRPFFPPTRVAPGQPYAPKARHRLLRCDRANQYLGHTNQPYAKRCRGQSRKLKSTGFSPGIRTYPGLIRQTIHRRGADQSGRAGRPGQAKTPDGV
jgi:hypothetical protein